MTVKEIFEYLNVALFIPKFTNLTYNSRFRQKMRGKDGNGKPIEFSHEEVKEIKKGLERLCKKINK